MRLTVVILTKNEEDKIDVCLESVRWADEVVVIDDMSDDRTVDICNSYGVKVVRNSLDNDFGKQRNLGIDNASGDWILQLDADEIVPSEWMQETKKILACGAEFNAYRCRRKNFFLGHFMRHGGWYHYSLRFFKRGIARYEGRIHEQLKVDGAIGTINAAIEHYPFKSLFQFIARQNFYTSVEAKRMLGEKGVLKISEIRYNLRIKPLKLFWKFYVKKKGFKDGMYGLVFSLLYAWLHFLKWAKYWEIVKEKEN